jgi:hypothetical protein
MPLVEMRPDKIQNRVTNFLGPWLFNFGAGGFHESGEPPKKCSSNGMGQSKWDFGPLRTLLGTEALLFLIFNGWQNWRNISPQIKWAIRCTRFPHELLCAPNVFQQELRVVFLGDALTALPQFCIGGGGFLLRVQGME